MMPSGCPAITAFSTRNCNAGLLQVTDLGKSFGGNRAVDGVSFQVAKGELLALIGPNGAGKSTTFNMVNGQLRADTGSITLDGTELIGRKPRDIWRLGVGRRDQARHREDEGGGMCKALHKVLRLGMDGRGATGARPCRA